MYTCIKRYSKRLSKLEPPRFSLIHSFKPQYLYFCRQIQMTQRLFQSLANLVNNRLQHNFLERPSSGAHLKPNRSADQQVKNMNKHLKRFHTAKSIVPVVLVFTFAFLWLCMDLVYWLSPSNIFCIVLFFIKFLSVLPTTLLQPNV